MRAALQWSFSDKGDGPLGVELAAWAPLFVGLSLLEECTRWCERALSGLNDAARGTRQEMILQEAFALSLMYTGGNSNQVRAAIERGLHLEETFGHALRKLQLFCHSTVFSCGSPTSVARSRLRRRAEHSQKRPRAKPDY